MLNVAYFLVEWGVVAEVCTRIISWQGLKMSQREPHASIHMHRDSKYDNITSAPLLKELYNIKLLLQELAFRLWNRIIPFGNFQSIPPSTLYSSSSILHQMRNWELLYNHLWYHTQFQLKTKFSCLSNYPLTKINSRSISVNCIFNQNFSTRIKFFW